MSLGNVKFIAAEADGSVYRVVLTFDSLDEMYEAYAEILRSKQHNQRGVANEQGAEGQSDREEYRVNSRGGLSLLPQSMGRHGIGCGDRIEIPVGIETGHTSGSSVVEVSEG